MQKFAHTAEISTKVAGGYLCYVHSVDVAVLICATLVNTRTDSF